jgi:superfamily II RNA helicase
VNPPDARTAPLAARLAAPSPLDGFVDYVSAEGISLYPAQEEALLEILDGRNVIMNTPTGSGKSLVAAGAHFAALAAGRRSVYTAPLKALVSEKFFALCEAFGAERVGMITGDAAVNPQAPIICATAEILANQALRDGSEADVDVVIADEFHFYADPQRGWAWQVPLLTLPQCQFVLLSATLGPTQRFADELTGRTGRETVTVRSGERPVPLGFEYGTLPLHASIEDLLERNRAPIYVVHFTQREAIEAAQAYTSIGVLSRAERDLVAEAIGGFKFDSPIGKDLRRLIGHGVGVHHAGLLPKYRLLTERLAQQGLLKLICGTDTLGVGVNVPIRTVLFTQLCKYDGQRTRLLNAREFHQIAGRAGRAGFDERGFVRVQAPAHWIENRVAEAKAASNPKAKRKPTKRRPPERNYAHWNEETFERLTSAEPEPLTSSFEVSHQMVMHMLDRPGDGCADLRRLLVENHETRRRQRRHIRRAVAIYRSLVDAGVVEVLESPDRWGRRVRVTVDLQDSFALHQPLSLFAVEALGVLDPDEEDYPRNVLSVIESVLENPGPIVAAQVERLRSELLGELKAQGVPYEERMERLGAVERPKPLREFLYGAFDIFRRHHPWVEGDNVRPKSVAREMHEQAMTFGEYVNHYGVKRSEGLLLRYLSDTYRALVQNVPAERRTPELDELTDWLGALVRGVDSSLVDEWERLTAVADGTLDGAAAGEAEGED